MKGEPDIDFEASESDYSPKRSSKRFPKLQESNELLRCYFKNSMMFSVQPTHPKKSCGIDGYPSCFFHFRLDESCSHVAAVLFKVEAAFRLGYTRTACTEQPCLWNKSFTKNVEATPVHKLISTNSLPKSVSYQKNGKTLIPQWKHPQISKRNLKEEKPFIGASPDAIVNCECHGMGVVEVKCPYKHKESDFVQVSTDSTQCLKIVDGQHIIKKGHPCYTQIQTQIYVCNVKYGDLVIWTLKSVIVLRIDRDNEFISNMVSDVSAVLVEALFARGTDTERRIIHV
ncbi:uncharacterized protein [Amphiura filiformis]|uniref:uncharacterized protein n=1 Tax=Amphiura filiformis TaxID=82378 RepID=UPI003B21BABA